MIGMRGGKKDLLNQLKSYISQRENSKVYDVQYVTVFVPSDGHKPSPQMRTIQGWEALNIKISR